MPPDLARAISRADGDPAAVRAAGIEWSIQLAEAVLAAGAPGLHFYTLNSSTATLEVCQRLAQAGLFAEPARSPLAAIGC